MRIIRFVMLMCIFGLLALVGTACGGSDKAAEKIAEEIVESSAGGKDVDVDIDGDKVTVNSKDGKGSFSASGELPDGWPDELALPKGAKIVASGTSTVAGANLQTVSAKVKGSPSEVMKHFEAALKKWKSEGSSNFNQGDSSFATGIWEKGEDKVTVNVSNDQKETVVVISRSAKK